MVITSHNFDVSHLIVQKDHSDIHIAVKSSQGLSQHCRNDEKLVKYTQMCTSILY